MILLAQATTDLSNLAAWKDLGIAAILVVGLFLTAWKILEVYPKIREGENTSKMERAKVYTEGQKESAQTMATAIERNGEQVSQALECLGEQIRNQGEEIKNQGREIRETSKVVEKSIDLVDRIFDELKNQTHICQVNTQKLDDLLRKRRSDT